MSIRRSFALLLAALAVSALVAPASAEKIVPRAGFAIAPLPTDEPVRSGMEAIRDLVRTNHSLITHRRMPPDHAKRFATQIKAESNRILSTTKLSGEALERLKERLVEIDDGADQVLAVAPGSDPVDGLLHIDEALARYPTEFDHPGWVPAQSIE